VLRDLFVALLVAGLVSVTFFVLAVALTWHRLKRQVRVRPSTPSPAPPAWLVGTSDAARLHRRLRRATETARVAASIGDGTLAALAGELEEQGVAVERQLVMLSKLGRGAVSADARRALGDRVARIEALSRRLADVAVRYPQRPLLTAAEEDSLTELSDRLEHLAAAREELAALEAMVQLEPRRQ